MRIFLTGASGFVGGRLRPRLEAAGHEAIGADDALDIRDPSALETEIARIAPDAIVHLAAQSSVAASWRDPGDCFRVNFLGTHNLIEAAARHAPRARILLVGSADEYMTTRADAPAYRESTGLRPGSPYARTKAAGELLGALACERGLDVMRTRSFNHTGAGQPDVFVASSFARQIAEIAAGKRAPRVAVGNLDSVRDFLDVEDVVRAYIALLDPTIAPDVFNVASGVPVTVAALLHSLIELAGVDPEITVNPDYFRPTDQLVGDPTRLREATGWRPTIPLRDTLASLLEGWQVRVAEAG
ncbi:MAG: NAD-dependent epimerase/dehydratase family protein [bacterium]|nr:NAD-dependent epimerase/dehydratase family protein [bacterium]